MPPDITAFLERYRDAFNALDADAVAGLYAEPSGIAQGGRYTHWPDRGAVRANMAALCELYRAKGYRRAAFELTRWLDQGDRHALVDLRWRIEWHGGEPAACFGTAYNLIRTDLGWRVLLCTAYEEDTVTGRRQ